MLTCIKCNKTLDFSNFHRKANSKTGYRSECKSCRKDYDLQRYSENKELIIEKSRQYYEKTKNDPEVLEKKKQYRSKYYRDRCEKEYEHYIVARCKKRANKNSLEFDLTEEDIIIPDFCPILGIPLIKGNGAVTKNSPSVDRIDPNKGYTKDNIQIISQLANAMKSNATPEDLLKFAEWVLQTYNKI